MFGVSIWFGFWLNFVPLPKINLKQNGLFQKKSTPLDGWGRFLTPLSPGFAEAQDPTSCLDFLDKRPLLPPGFPQKSIRLKFNLSLIFDEKLKKNLKNTKCEGVKVNQLFTFFTSIITQNTRDLT